jgi:glycosyltransferase involved in cell wall biosynthesis
MVKLVFVFDHFGPYHVARVGAAAGLPGCVVTGVELHPRSRTYGWEPREGELGFRKVSLPRVELRGRAERRALRPHLERVLGECGPDVVFVNGWGDFLSVETMAWAKRRGVRVVVMSETRRVDGARSWWGEWVKGRIVGLCDAGLCGGESHRRYLGELGLPRERVALGYNAVDNQFFGEIRNAKWGMGNGGVLTTKHTNIHEKGGAELTTEDTESTEDRFVQNKGSAWTSQAGASESDSLASELAVSPVSESPTRSASGPASALRVDEDRRSEIGDRRTDGTEGANALDSGRSTLDAASDGEPLRGGSRTERSPSLQSGTMALDSGRWSLVTAPEALAPYFLASNRFVERKNLGRLIEAYARYCAACAALEMEDGRSESVERGAGNLEQGAGGGVWPLVLLGDGELRGELEALCGRLKLRKAEMGDFLTTEDTESTEEEAGLRPGSRAGASESDSLTSELADSPVSESPTRSAIGPALAAEPPRADGGCQGTEVRDRGEGGGAADGGERMADGGCQRSEVGGRRSEKAESGNAEKLKALDAGRWTLDFKAPATRHSLPATASPCDAPPATSHSLPATAAGGGLVVFAGFRQVEEVREFYAGAGVFIHPALAEPWGLVINEAMASGLPVLSSRNVGAAEELVHEGVNGFMFDPMSVEELAGLMGRMAGMPVSERLAMGGASRGIVANWGPGRFAEGVREAVGMAMGGRGRRAAADGGWRMADGGRQRSEVGGQRSEDGDQRSEVGGQRSEDGDQMTDGGGEGYAESRRAGFLDRMLLEVLIRK